MVRKLNDFDKVNLYRKVKSQKSAEADIEGAIKQWLAKSEGTG